MQQALLKARHGKMYEWNIANTVEMHKGLHKEEIDVVTSLKAFLHEKRIWLRDAKYMVMLLKWVFLRRTFS